MTWLSKRACGVMLLCAFAWCVLLLAGTQAHAEDVSAPPILEFFESSWQNMQSRMPDVFMAGYGVIQAPPPYRADSGNQSVGYDVFNRFDLGSPGDSTLYGTQQGFKQMIDDAHQAGISVYTDLIWNHDGFRDTSTPNFSAQGGYPGFAITLQTTDPNAPGYNTQGYNDLDGDFHSAYASGDENERLAGLIDIAQDKNYQFIRNPVDPNNPDNISGGTLDNQPKSSNRQYYPDTSLPSLHLTDEDGHAVTIYPFNTANPMAGDAVKENALGYLMRNAQWMVQVMGVDGFRIDAAKNFPSWVLKYYDQAVFDAIKKPLLNGSRQNVFAYSEVFDGNMQNVQSRILKNIDPNNPTQIGGNRDALDFPLYFAMRQNLTGTTANNDWRNVINASIDVNDDGYANNGSQGVSFVSAHDSSTPPPALDNVAYAYTLMRPGNTIVYFNAHQFGDDRSFPIDGRGDALGGMYGDAITKLVNIRDTHGRGNFVPEYVGQHNLAFERQGSALVLLSNRTDAGYDSRTIHTDFAPGTHLIELTGNATNPNVDPLGDIPGMLTVDSNGNVQARFLRNSSFNAQLDSFFTGKGYLVYGLAAPQGQVSLSNVAEVIHGNAPIAATNGTTRLANINVIKSDDFDITLNTDPVFLMGTVRDKDADGDNALLKLDGGVDVNGNGIVDLTQPGSVSYGFENFTTVHDPGFFNADGYGEYEQAMDAQYLSEGYHTLTVRAFRHRGDGGPAIFTDFRKVIYVDLLPPKTRAVSFAAVSPDASNDREFIAQSVDHTANNMHLFLDLPAGLTNAEILSRIGSANQADFLATDLWQKEFQEVGSGNHALTIVAYEIDGNYSITRETGWLTNTSHGAGLGDTDFNDTYTPNDIAVFASVLDSDNMEFDPAADMNGDGLVNLADLRLLGPRLESVDANLATMQAYDQLVASVPEPATWIMVILGTCFLVMMRTRRRRGMVSA